MQLRPFFTYFGGKYRAAPRYDAPRHNTIIEPFAGSAGYSVRNHEKQVILYDVDPIIYGVWDYLIHAKPSEILALPSEVEHVNDIPGPQEARWLVGFWLNKGRERPRLTPSKWMRLKIHPHSFWGDTIKERIASQVEHIRHWQVFNKSYEDAINQEATWFVDPPYVKAGKCYRFNKVDYTHLAYWCRDRQGQTIVCEQFGAAWLPFESIGLVRSNYKTIHSHEVAWTK